MKLAWICYNAEWDNEKEIYRLSYDHPIIVFTEPDKFDYYKIVPIVYAEIEK